MMKSSLIHPWSIDEVYSSSVNAPAKRMNSISHSVKHVLSASVGYHKIGAIMALRLRSLLDKQRIKVSNRTAKFRNSRMAP